MSDKVQVTRQEEFLYNTYAPMIRRLGQAAAALEQARGEAEQILASSSEADGATVGERDEKDRSPHTAWFEDSVFTPIWTLFAQLIKDHSRIAGECIERERQTREGIDSLPAVPLAKV